MTVYETFQNIFRVLKDGLFVELMIVVLGIMLLRVAYRLQRTANSIDFTKLIVSQDNEVSLIKLMQFVGFIVVTWVIVVYTVRGLLTEWLFTAYFTIASGTQIFNRYASRGEIPPPVQTTVTATVGPGQSATATAGAAPEAAIIITPKEE